MKNSLETRLGLFLALAVVGGFVLFEIAGGGVFLDRRREVRARFQSAQDLKPGDPVKLAGVNIGRVSDIHLAGQAVEVVMKVSDSAELRTDSTASIRFTGLMGQNYVSLDFGTGKAPLLQPGQLLQSKEQPDLSAIMTKLDGVADGVQNMTKSFSGEEFRMFLGPITEVVKDNQPRIAAIMSNVQTLSSNLVAGQGTVGKLLKSDEIYSVALSTVTNLSDVAHDAHGMLGDAQHLVTDARKVMEGVNKGEGSVGKLLKDPKMADELTQATTNLKEILQKINQGQGSVGKLVNDDSFLKNVKLTLQKVDKATEGLEDTGPLSVIGTAVQTLF